MLNPTQGGASSTACVGGAKLSGGLPLGLPTSTQVRVVMKSRLHGGALFRGVSIRRTRFGLDRSF